MTTKKEARKRRGEVAEKRDELLVRVNDSNSPLKDEQKAEFRNRLQAKKFTEDHLKDLGPAELDSLLDELHTLGIELDEKIAEACRPDDKPPMLTQDDPLYGEIWELQKELRGADRHNLFKGRDELLKLTIPQAEAHRDAVKQRVEQRREESERRVKTVAQQLYGGLSPQEVKELQEKVAKHGEVERKAAQYDALDQKWKELRLEHQPEEVTPVILQQVVEYCRTLEHQKAQPERSPMATQGTISALADEFTRQRTELGKDIQSDPLLDKQTKRRFVKNLPSESTRNADEDELRERIEKLSRIRRSVRSKRREVALALLEKAERDDEYEEIWQKLHGKDRRLTPDGLRSELEKAKDGATAADHKKLQNELDIREKRVEALEKNLATAERRGTGSGWRTAAIVSMGVCVFLALGLYYWYDQAMDIYRLVMAAE